MLAKILVPAGTPDVAVGTPMMVLIESEDDVAAFKDFSADAAPEAAAAAPAAAAPAAKAEPPAPSEPAPAPAAAAAPPAAPGGRVAASPLAKLVSGGRGGGGFERGRCRVEGVLILREPDVVF